MSIIDSQETVYREEHEIDVLTRRIAELERERDEWQLKCCEEAGLHASHVFQRDELIRDMARELRDLNDGGVSTDCMEHERRMREIGIEVD